MKLPRTEKYVEEGIKMVKKISNGGFFSYPTYDYKTVYDLEEALSLNQENWQFNDYVEVFSNLALMLWRDLRDYEEVNSPAPSESEKEDK